MRGVKMSGIVRKGMTAFLGGFLALTVMLSVPVSANDVGTWRKAVIKTIIKSHVYPRSAISREIEGSAKVKITISRAGDITGYEVMQPTGEDVLDEVIPTMVDKMNPLPAPPDALPDANLTFVIPLTWRLQ